jgi:hypothetical protein
LKGIAPHLTFDIEEEREVEECRKKFSGHHREGATYETAFFFLCNLQYGNIEMDFLVGIK